MPGSLAYSMRPIGLVFRRSAFVEECRSWPVGQGGRWNSTYQMLSAMRSMHQVVTPSVGPRSVLGKAPECERSSVIGYRSAVTIGNRLSPIPVSRPRLARPTAPLKRSRIPNGRSGLECNGIPKVARTTAFFSDSLRLPQASTHEPDTDLAG